MDATIRLCLSEPTQDENLREDFIKDNESPCSNRSEPEENQTVDKISKGFTKKGRRKRKRGKVKREGSIENDARKNADTNDAIYNISNTEISSINALNCTNASQIEIGKVVSSVDASKKSIFNMKRCDKVGSSLTKVNKSSMSWLDGDLGCSEINDEQILCVDNASNKNISLNKSHVVDGGISKKSSKSNASWLDMSDVGNEDDYDDAYNALESTCTVNTRKELNVIFNKTDGDSQNLTRYRQRFFVASDNRVMDKSIDFTADKIQSWNNEKVIKNELNTKIGINVNEWNRNIPIKKKDKYDGTKRSRRKTEPFDFDKQADGELEETELSTSLPFLEKSNYSTSDIPSGLCNFMADGNDNSMKDLHGRNLLCGSISGKGLFIPFADFDSRLSREVSLEKIFNEHYSEDSDEFVTESNIESEDGKSESENEDDQWSSNIFGALPPEPQLGNVEYKLKLVNPTKQRFEHLVTQMKWRLREGQGEALYEIGVRDCGRVQGLAPVEMRASLHTLRRMATRLGAACTLLGYRRLPDTRRALAEVLVRKVPDDQHNIEVRVAVMGSNDAGKSTLVGVLTQGELDNGRGSARLNMFRHLHEVKTGRTSSVSHEILGFDSQGRPVNYAYSELMTSEEINERSSKLVSFIDLAGHRKYLKTTVQGLTGYSPHYAMLVVSATAGINQMTLEHLALVVALNLPFFIVLTKIDATSPDQIIKQLEEELKSIGCRKVPLLVSNMDHAVAAGPNVASRSTVPVLPVSSVTGKGLDILRWFLFLVPPTTTPAKLEQEPIEFQVDETFKIGDSSGPVVGGLLKKGVLTEKTKLLIGPLDTGDFVPISVNSLHRNKAPCRVVRAGQAASLGLSWLPPRLRQGMFLLAVPDNYEFCDDNLQLLTNRYSKLGVNTKKEKSQNWKQCDVLQNNPKVSPKLSKKNKHKNVELNSKIIVDKDVNIMLDTKNKHISLQDVEIATIFNNLNCKSNDVRDIEANLQKDSDSENRITRLSPSRYTARFTNIFLMDTVNPNPDTNSEETEESTSSDSDAHKEVEDCTCRKESNDTTTKDAVISGNNLTEDPKNPRGCYFFQATVSLLNHSAAIFRGCQSTVHIGNIRQTAVIEGIFSHDGILRANEEASVLFRFLRHPEYVRTGARILFREALHTKGVGKITQVFPHKDLVNAYCKKHKPRSVIAKPIVSEIVT